MLFLLFCCFALMANSVTTENAMSEVKVKATSNLQEKHDAHSVDKANLGQQRPVLPNSESPSTKNFNSKVPKETDQPTSIEMPKGRIDDLKARRNDTLNQRVPSKEPIKNEDTKSNRTAFLKEPVRVIERVPVEIQPNKVIQQKEHKNDDVKRAIIQTRQLKEPVPLDKLETQMNKTVQLTQPEGPKPNQTLQLKKHEDVQKTKANQVSKSKQSEQIDENKSNRPEKMKKNTDKPLQTAAHDDKKITVNKKDTNHTMNKVELPKVVNNRQMKVYETTKDKTQTNQTKLSAKQNETKVFQNKSVNTDEEIKPNQAKLNQTSSSNKEMSSNKTNIKNTEKKANKKEFMGEKVKLNETTNNAEGSQIKDVSKVKLNFTDTSSNEKVNTIKKGQIEPKKELVRGKNKHNETKTVEMPIKNKSKNATDSKRFIETEASQSKQDASSRKNFNQKSNSTKNKNEDRNVSKENILKEKVKLNDPKISQLNKKPITEKPGPKTNTTTTPKEKPNIVFIVADDLGWDDVSFHGSDQILTPNIDTMAYQSIMLHNYYTDTLGTSSRSALLTGKYPLRLGTQGASIKSFEDRGIPTSERLLPSHLKKLGYKTHLVGKWDVGKSREHYLPTNRGFDTFYGFLGGCVDYFTYNTIENFNNTSFYGLDFFDNRNPVENQTGHLTDVLTERARKIIRNHNTSSPLYLHLSHAAPHMGGGLVNLQPPTDTLDSNDHIAHSARRLYAGLVTSLDRSVGHIVAALAERDILKNTLIVFVSDNGAPSDGRTQHFGSNLPLRGMKNTPWEGGARATAFLWHPALKSQIRHGLFHVTDWLPTLVAAAGGNVDGKIDGINQWDAIKRGQPKRNDVLITIDDQNGWAALREGDFKMIVGDVSTDISQYFGIEYQALRRNPPVYEKTLLECESYYVLRETLNMTLNVDVALNKRNESNLLNYNPNSKNKEPCIPNSSKGCLYNVREDPLEINDLWHALPDIVKKLSLRLRTIWTELKPRAIPHLDSRANPAKHNYTWFPWVPNNEKVKQPLTTIREFPLRVSMSELQYLVDLNLDMFKEKVYESIRSMGDSFMKTVGGLFSF